MVILKKNKKVLTTFRL